MNLSIEGARNFLQLIEQGIHIKSTANLRLFKLGTGYCVLEVSVTANIKYMVYDMSRVINDYDFNDEKSLSVLAEIIIETFNDRLKNSGERLLTY